MRGYQFGNSYTDKTPADFIDDPVTGIRPGSYAKKKPLGCGFVDLSEGIRSYHVIPPVAIWDRGKWYDQLELQTQNAINVKPDDERQTWIVSGQGTPGDFVLRAYKVPEKIAEFQAAKHPADWSKKHKEKGDKKESLLGDGYSTYSWSGYQPATKAKPPSPPKPPPIPTGVTFRCVGCGHWFEGETKLAGHATHCCPGSSNWGDEGSDWVIACKCCLTFDETAVCKPGYPRKPVATKAKEGDEVAATA